MLVFFNFGRYHYGRFSEGLLGGSYQQQISKILMWFVQVSKAKGFMDSGAPGDPRDLSLFGRSDWRRDRKREVWNWATWVEFFIFSPQQKLLENCKSRHFHQPTSTGWFAKLFNYLPIKVVFPFLLGRRNFAGKFRPRIQVSGGFVFLKEPLPDSKG